MTIPQEIDKAYEPDDTRGALRVQHHTSLVTKDALVAEDTFWLPKTLLVSS